jgi:excisionase family DNA binding protein
MRLRGMLSENPVGLEMSVSIHETATPTEAETLLARESLRQISDILTLDMSALRIRIQGLRHPGSEIELPASAVRVLAKVLAEMAQGHAVALLPVQAELTTQQAADILSVSRPFLIGLLEQRKIPFRLVGQHRRVRLDDLLAYQRKDDENRRRIADELTADAQELGVGY